LQSKPRFKSIHRPGEDCELVNALVIREHLRDPRFQLRILGSTRDRLVQRPQFVGGALVAPRCEASSQPTAAKEMDARGGPFSLRQSD